MSALQPSAVEELLAKWEAGNAGTPVRPVVQQAIDLGFTVVPPGGSGGGRYLRLLYDPPAGTAITLYVDAQRLTAAGAGLRQTASALPGAVVRPRDVQFPFATADPAQVLTSFRDAAADEPAEQATALLPAPPAGRRTSTVRALVGALVALLVIGGAATSGFAGALRLLGLAVLLVGLGALVTGSARWALIASRAVGAGVAAVGVVALTLGAVASPPTEPAARTAASQPSASAASSSAAQTDADVEAATEAAEAALTQAEGDESSTDPALALSTSGLLTDTAATTAVETAGPTTALAALAAVPVKGRAPKTGYSRDQFGAAWTDVDRNGCDTRNDILARDLTGESFKPGTRDCVVLTGSLADPYSGRSIAFRRGQSTSEAVQIDHVVALSNAWQTGAQGWDGVTRTAFANDPLNLLAVDGPLNMQKGDGDAATWLPPSKGYRCAYVARQVAVKVRYGLWMTQAERNAIATVLSACPNEPLPGGVVANVPARPTAAAPVPVAPPVAAPRSTAAPRPVPAPVVVPPQAPAPKPAPKPAPAPAPKPAPAPGPGVSYANCTAVRAAGAAPIYRGQPGYSKKLDRDGDGVACE